MGRRSMEELLNAFDPLHSSNGSTATSSTAPPPLFPSSHTASSATSASSSSNNGSKSAPADLGHVATFSNHAPVPLSSAPLDLLSFDDNDGFATKLPSAASASSSVAHETISSNNSKGGQANQSSSIASTIQDRASRRQEDILEELHNADQTFAIPSMHTGTMTSASPPVMTRPTPRQRRPSSGFSPPRRMSRSGLMHDEQHISQIRSSSIPAPGEPHSPTLEILGHVPSTPSTQISEEPAPLFHPSSPPAGTTIESLRQKKGYFPPPPPPVQSIFDRPVPTSDRQRRTSSSDRQAFQTLNDGSNSSQQNAGGANAPDPAHSRKTSGNRAAFIQNALRGPPPPFSSPTLKQSATSQPQPIPGTSTSTASGPNATHGQQPASGPIASPSSPITKAKLSRKPTFDFPLFSSLSSSVSSHSHKSQSLPPSAAIQVKDELRSGSNTPSPASSLIIDSDPLPSLVLKVTGAARDARRVLTEDIADGIRMALPPRIRLCKSWTLLYSLDAHGTSLTTLYTRVQAGLQKSSGGCVLVVKDMDGGVFGAYVNEAFKKSESYYGNGECFLWKVESFPPSDNFRVGPIVRAFRWTAKNDYIILSDSGFLSIGGGDGKFGLWLDSSFDKGFTTSCPAFANEPLCSPSLIKNGVDGNPEGKFEIMAVECWAVG